MSASFRWPSAHDVVLMWRGTVSSGYRIRLGAEDLEKRGEVLRQLIEMAYRGPKDKP